MEVSPQLIFARLQARIAQLELDNAFLSAGLEQLTGESERLREAHMLLEKEHARCPGESFREGE